MNMVDLTLLWPPLLAGVVVLSTHVPLGRQVLKRGIIFIDLAVAQLAGLGVILIHLLIDQPPGWTVQSVAFMTAATGSLGLRWAERHWGDVLEAIIGVVFILAVTAALILLANDPHGGDRLKDLLAGQLLWVSYEDLWLPAILSLGILAFWFKSNVTNQSTLFYGLFALSVTMSVQLVGVYLVFASLIVPALATRHRQGLAFAYGVGMAGYLLGLMLSALLDLPTGPIVVWAMALIAVVTAFSDQFVIKRKGETNNL
ncbi:zinc/manganese transporter permease [bacterium endosymbiont of Escarpia laminata]|nr:MAG: zinc/manganese transporter permease [bacterium endosymbiont of Escarpia laminata]